MRTVLKWPVIFIGASPDAAPAMYSLMTYAGHALGTWYPSGGMAAPALALAETARGMGVEIVLGTEVTALQVDAAGAGERVVAVCHRLVTAADATRSPRAGQASADASRPQGLLSGDGGAGADREACTAVDGVVSAGDYHHFEQTLLPPHLRRYTPAFWDEQVRCTPHPWSLSVLGAS